jgi:uncharacterized protein (DUF342 family)
MLNFQYKFVDKKLALTVTFDHSSEELTDSAVIENVQKSEYSSLELLHHEISNFVKIVNIELADIKKNHKPEKSLTTTIANGLNAKISVSISDDKMEVEAEVTTPIGGEHVNLEIIKQLCIDTGVRYGLKSSLISELLEQCELAAPGANVKYIIAKGLAPVNGKNAKLKPLVEPFSESLRTPQEREDGTVDLKDLGNIDTISAGTPVLEKVSLTLGSKGMNVFGEYIEAEPGNDVKFFMNPTLVESPNNPNLILAAHDGLARFDGKEMIIDDVFVLPELDPKKGHIKFKGSVVIHGDVSPDMHLTATGDVMIGGFVESAVIKCGGELTILSGASGRIDEHATGKHYTCILQAAGQINLDFANQCEITSKTLVNVKRQLTHCYVEAKTAVVGQGDRPNGQISGGHFLLCKTLEAGTIGTESNVPTEISMNRTYDIFIKKEVELADWIQEMISRRDTLEEEHHSLLDSDKKQKLESNIKTVQKKIDKYTGYRTELIRKRRDYMDEVWVKVNKRLYPKVTFHITNHAIISEEKGPSEIKLDEFEVKVLPLA